MKADNMSKGEVWDGMMNKSQRRISYFLLHIYHVLSTMRHILCAPYCLILRSCDIWQLNRYVITVHTTGVIISFSVLRRQ